MMIIEILGFDDIIRQRLLDKFRKWFVLIIQTYGNVGNNKSEYIFGEFWDLYYIFQKKYSKTSFRQLALTKVFIELLPWFNIHHSGIDFIVSFLSMGKSFCRMDKLFINEIRYNLIHMFINNMDYNEEGNIVIPSWCQELIDRVKNEESEDLVMGIEEALHMYREK